nr:patatin-like phospholipase domain-containing protein [Quercus suber]
MGDPRKLTDGPSVSDRNAWDVEKLPDYDNDFVNPDDILAFASALAAPETSPSEENLLNPAAKQDPEFITAINDWKPVRQKVKGRQRKTTKKRKKLRRDRDETREGWTYSLVKYPLLVVVFGWIIFLGASYLVTRLYIFSYERLVTWRGTRYRLRKRMRCSTSYEDWVKAAGELDHHLGGDAWKTEDEYAYYDSRTITRVTTSMAKTRQRAEQDEKRQTSGIKRPVSELRGLVEGCVKNNFAGFENTRLYSETYYGTKDLVQHFVDETTASLKFLFDTEQLSSQEKRDLAQHLSTNFGRTALCLSGGATFAYYHFGIGKALLDAALLPNIVTGTSGGALVAALLTTRTDEELKKLLVPALASRINACQDATWTWMQRWWRTGARFDSVDWAKRCAWFCHGSLTFREAYERTGRILNVTCVPSDPHSPNILANYRTSPDCVIWSAVLASAAVPGILNPVVLMRKTADGRLEPYSFGHKWKDGSLRTDIPLKSLNLHFNVNFSIVSQVNPHINLFFFSSRGTPGSPVTHRRGRGWRGGFLGSAIEQYLKLDLNKWLKVLRHLELLPRPLGQDWSMVWLQRFNGTITIWPKSILSDYWNILSDPDMERLARMIHVGQLAAWPNVKFIANRMAIEKAIEEAREKYRPQDQPLPTPMPNPSDRRLRGYLSEEDLHDLLARARSGDGTVEIPFGRNVPSRDFLQPLTSPRAQSPSFSKRFSGWFGSRMPSPSPVESKESGQAAFVEPQTATMARRRRGSAIDELVRQSNVFWDDVDETELDEFATEDDLEETENEQHSDDDTIIQEGDL